MVYCTTVIMNMARVSRYGTQKARVTQVQSKSRISFKVFIPQTNKVPIKLRRSKNINSVRKFQKAKNTKTLSKNRNKAMHIDSKSMGYSKRQGKQTGKVWQQNQSRKSKQIHRVIQNSEQKQSTVKVQEGNQQIQNRLFKTRVYSQGFSEDSNRVKRSGLNTVRQNG